MTVHFRQVKPKDIPAAVGEFEQTPDGKIKLTRRKVPDKYQRAKFQVIDIAKLREKMIHKHSSANWSEMGCYKSTTGLWLSEELKCKRVLIITTKTGKVTFFQHVPYLLPDHKLINFEASAKPAGLKIPAKCICLAHFNLFQDRSQIKTILLKQEWDLVLIDEAHRIKNRNAQWTKNIRKLKAKYKHIMTGSGFINKPDEIWSLLHFLYPKQFTSYWSFRRTYCSEDTGLTPDGRQYSVVTGIKPEMETDFKTIVWNAGVRRTKAELFKELPERYTTIIPIALNPTQRRMYDEMKKQLMMLDEQGYPISSPNVLSALSRLRQVCVATPEVAGEDWSDKMGRIITSIRLSDPSSKLDALMDLLDGTDSPVVVFSNFTDTFRLLKVRLDKAKVSYVHMQAKDSDSIRQEKVSTFQAGKTKVFMSTLSLGSESITLTAASTVVFIDRSWSPATNEQAIARVHRPGQLKPVQVIQIEALSTVDQYVESKLKQKQRWFDTIFNSGNA